MSENGEKILSLIRKGRLDEDLDDLADALYVRRKRMDQVRFVNLQIGARVMVIDGVKPKYMVGAVGEVVEKRQSKVTVQFSGPMGRFGSKVVCPVSILREVPSEQT